MKYEVKDFEERYFAGLEFEGGVTLGKKDDIPKLWDKFLNDVLEDIPSRKKGFPVIGLECYPPDFMESKVYDYYSLVETEGLITSDDLYVTKKLPKGKYISFEIGFDLFPDYAFRIGDVLHFLHIHFGLDQVFNFQQLFLHRRIQYRYQYFVQRLAYFDVYFFAKRQYQRANILCQLHTLFQ